jgi:hypothetical protein
MGFGPIGENPLCRIRRCLVWVKRRKTQNEQMFSALTPRADILVGVRFMEALEDRFPIPYRPLRES